MFNISTDVPYTRFLARLHQSMTFEWYMEVGCRTGRSFAAVRGKTIAVDPFFRIKNDVISEKPALLLLQKKSDDFFASGLLESIGVKLSFSFLDGMHLMEFLLRDFMNTEKNSLPGGVIALHDCCPFSFEMTTRDVENAPRDAWTGDVWKLIPILKKHRPDLKITVLGCKPTGLVFVHNLNPESKVLHSKYDEIVSEWQDPTLEEYGVSKFNETFSYTPCESFVDGGYEIFDKVRLSVDSVAKPEFVSP
ncbi:hypothetical protein AB9F29_00480 [Falsihalocynthiibacter sp. S25ZX9]|uniref:hypothetical protein n=1 Tax=Falsihalocynthiibacter sp. S25ZX9 TaxID=3240870 RepID=UPI003510069D